MSIFDRIFGSLASGTIPTVEFDPSRVTDEVCDDLRRSIEALPDIRPVHRDAIFDAAHLSISRSCDQAVLVRAIMAERIAGMTKSRGAEISRLLNNRATGLMAMAKQEAAGVTHAK